MGFLHWDSTPQTNTFFVLFLFLFSYKFCHLQMQAIREVSSTSFLYWVSMPRTLLYPRRKRVMALIRRRFPPPRTSPLHKLFGRHPLPFSHFNHFLKAKDGSRQPLLFLHFLVFLVIKSGSRQPLYFSHLYQMVKAKGGSR